MKIKSITIELFSNSTDQLELSLDKIKNVNFIIGKNSSGKTRMFNMIKSFFVDSNIDNKIQLEKIDNDEKVDVDLLFIGEDYIEEIKSLERFLKNLSSEEINLIEKLTKEFLSDVGGVFENNFDFHITDGIVNVNQNLAAGPTIELNYALLTSIRHILAPNHPLIIDDGGFSRMTPNSMHKTIELISTNSEQLLLFLTDVAFSATISSEDNTSESLSDKLKKSGRLGNVYILDREEIKKFE